MFASDMHPTKKDKSYRLQTMKIHVSMDVSSIENQPYLIKTHLQVEEKKRKDNNFLDIYVPLPNRITNNTIFSTSQS